MKHAAVHSLLLLSLAGCLEVVGAQAPPECAVSTDCNTGAGEVCDEGLCYGDPPAARYAVVVGPPADRPDLAPTAHLEPSIAIDGWMQDLGVAPAMYLRGRLEAICEGCPEGASIAATITVRRAPLIPGGPEFLVSAQSMGGMMYGDSFSIAVPRIQPEDPQYQVTIEPSATTSLSAGGPTLAEVIPPLRLTVSFDELANGMDVMLAAGDVQVVNGRVVDSFGEGLNGMRVHAKGRVDPLRPLERVSTIATTDDGYFTLVLGADALDIVDIIATPSSDFIAPTLTLRDRFVGAQESVELRMPPFSGSILARVPVVHVETNGSRTPLAGARVVMSTRLDDLFDPGVEAEYSVEGYTESDGQFVAEVVAGAQPLGYSVRVLPPASAAAASHADIRMVGPEDTTVETLELAARSTLTGQIVDSTGVAVDGLTVSAVPSLPFVWTLGDDAAESLSERETPSAVTNPDGTFTLWVDPAIGGVAATYDLDCEPPQLANVPRWIVWQVNGAQSKDLGFVQLPDAAHIRAVIEDPDQRPLAGAAVRIYELVDVGACIAENAPDDCEPPAVLRASGQSDAEGVVRLVLPR